MGLPLRVALSARQWVPSGELLMATPIRRLISAGLRLGMGLPPRNKCGEPAPQVDQPRAHRGFLGWAIRPRRPGAGDPPPMAARF
jgi:hypothetical protein